MIAQSNVTHLVIGKDTALALNTDTRNTLDVGQIGVFLAGSATAMGGATALTAGNKFSIVYKRVDGTVIETPVIEYNNILRKTSTATVAATVASKALGFNGTAGSIDVANNEDYVVHYTWYDNLKSTGMGKPTKFLAYRSDASATQVEIAAGLVSNSASNNKKEKYPVIIADLLINNAGAAVTGAPTNFTFTKGSKTVVWTGTDPTNIVAGDYIRVGTAVTDVCYPVSSVSLSTNSLTLGYSFQGTTVTALNAAVEVIVAATAATAAAGVKFTAQTMPFKAGLLKYSPVYFDFWKIGEGFGSTTVTDSLTEATNGKGTYQEVDEVEWFLRGNRGEPNRVADYPVEYVADAVSGKTYDQIVFDYKDNSVTTLDRQVDSYGTVWIATEDESAATANTELKLVLGIS